MMFIMKHAIYMTLYQCQNYTFIFVIAELEFSHR